MTLDAVTGSVYLSSPLDFEDKTFHEFTIFARDIDRLSSEALLAVHVIDANDNPPHFIDRSPLNLTIRSDFEANQFLHHFLVDDEVLFVNTFSPSTPQPYGNIFFLYNCCLDSFRLRLF